MFCETPLPFASPEGMPAATVPATKGEGMAATADGKVRDYRFEEAKRKNNPPAGLAAQGRIAERPAVRYAYDPHLPPVLRFDATGEADRYPELLEEARRRPLREDEIELLAEALQRQEPWLEWSGKQEAKGFAVDP